MGSKKTAYALPPAIDTKSGGYTIRANATGVPGDPDSTFTFWWGDDAMPTEYFDVSIEPNPVNFPMIPLVETQRAYDIAPATPRQAMLILTLRNPNDFDVDFFATHFRAILI
jgi:hypothetical protein